MYRCLKYFILCDFVCLFSFGQTDTLKKRPYKIVIDTDTNLVLSGTRIISKTDTSEFHKLELSAYVSTYYASYSDENTGSEFVKFPTMAARNNQFGLNLAQIGMKYQDQNYRGNITLHYGDIPESNWPKPFTLIQEANAGIKLIKNLWFDAGFFKTHLGVESIQPRENITSSMAVTTYFEPYYLSGAKLTYQASSKLSIQINAFNGFNTYVETNKNKALGLSVLYDLNKNISITYNLLSCDETPDNVKTKHQRFYHDLYATFKFKKLSIGAEVNFGTQKNSLLTDTTQSASMCSGLVVAKYQMVKKLAAYARGEYFSDKNRILTTLNIGSYIYGVTGGVEFKPYKNAALSAEYRLLESENLIFKENGSQTNQRNEFILCLDVWF